MEQDRNLLFGVLAVQLKNVAPRQLVEAAEAWAKDPSRDVSERLVEAGALSREDCAELEALVRETLRARHQVSTIAFPLFTEEGPPDRGDSDVYHSGEGMDESAEEPANAVSGFVHAVIESPGRYADVREYGRGAMGRVLLVSDRHLGRDIALKELLPISAISGTSGELTPVRLSAAYMARFLQEARITGQLEHPAIVPVYEIGHRKNGTLYYTMKLVRGKTLGEAIKQTKSLDERLKFLPHFVDLCQAIAYAHSRGVIHRDIKPKNVMVGEFGETVILDWGLARAKNKYDFHTDGLAETLQFMRRKREGDISQTAYGTPVGTPAYMSPEQAEGKLDEVDERADIYGLGAVLYELLTGRAPFSNGNLDAILKKVMQEEPPAILAIDPGVPPELVAICQRSMAKDKTARYASAKDLADEIERFQTGALVQAYAYRPDELVRRYVHRHRAVLFTCVAAVFLLLVAGLLSYARVLEERDLAVVAQQAEQRARERAEKVQDEAQQAREEEQRARERAERESYGSILRLAQEYVEDGFYDLANEALWETREDQRDWEWGYLVARCNENLVTCAGHEHGISDMALSSSGAYLLTASNDNTARVWEVHTGRPVATLRGHGGALSEIYFSRDEARAVTVSLDGTVRVWDARTGKERVALKGHTFGSRIYASWSPDEERMVTAAWDTAKVWDIGSGTIRATVPDVQRPYFSPDGTRILAITTQGGIKLWDASSYLERATIVEQGVRFEKAAYSPDGSRFLGTGSDNMVRVWDAETQVLLCVLAAHAGPILHASWSADGRRIVTASQDRSAKVWDVDTGKLVTTLVGHKADVVDATFSPDGTRVATASWDNSAKIWSAETGDLCGTLLGHSFPVTRVVFSPDGELVITASEDGAAKVWDVEQCSRVDDSIPPGAILHALSEESDVHVTADGKWLVTACSEGSVGVWDLEHGTEVVSLMTRAGSTYAAISPDGRRLVTLFGEPLGFHSNVWLWDAETETLLATVVGHTALVNDVSFSPDGATFATAANDNTAKIWYTGTASEKLTLTGHTGAVRAVAFSPDGTRIATVSLDQTLRVWDVATGTQIAVFQDESKLRDVAFSPDGARIATTGETGLNVLGRIRDAITGEVLTTFERPAQKAGRVSFNPTGTRLVGASTDASRVRDAETGRELLSLSGLSAATFDPLGFGLVGIRDGIPSYLEAAPFRPEMLPGDTSTDWRARFELYRRERFAASKLRTSMVRTAFDLVVITEDEFARRIHQLVRVYALKATDAASPADGDNPRPGLPIAQGSAADILSHFCLREGDRIMRVNGQDVRNEHSFLQALRALDVSPELDSEIPPTFTVMRGEAVREVRFYFIEPLEVRREVVLPRATAITLVSMGLSLSKEEDLETFYKFDRSVARNSGEVILDGEPLGFWIGPPRDAVEASIFQHTGVQCGDRMISAGGNAIRDRTDLVSVLETLRAKLVDASVDSYSCEIERGQFQRVTFTFTLQ